MADENEAPVQPVVPPQTPVTVNLPTGGNAEGENVNPEDSRATRPETIAKQVLAGQWGRGRRRDQRLKDAGHEPDAVREAYYKILDR